MNDVDRELSHLFDSAREVTEPTLEDRSRIRAALAAKLASGVLLGSASAGAAAGAAHSARVGLLKVLKIALLTPIGSGLIVGALIGGGTGVVATAMTETTTVPVDTAVTPPKIGTEMPRSPQASQDVTKVGPSRESPAIASPVPTSRSSSRGVPETPASASTPHPVSAQSAIAAFPGSRQDGGALDLRSELAVVSRMHAAWQRGDWAGVQTAIRNHEQQFPRGTLVEEREAVKVMLACRSADPARALELGSAFASRHPGSTHAARVGEVCGRRR
jgi:hypothetical protein